MIDMKIITRSCYECGARVMVFCTEGSQIIAVRCPTCTIKFDEAVDEYNRNVSSGGE